jgi:hypothetical protein
MAKHWHMEFGVGKERNRKDRTLRYCALGETFCSCAHYDMHSNVPHAESEGLGASSFSRPFLL